MTNEQVVERYAAAAAANDLPALSRLRHRDWTVEWPQSGERVLSSDAFARIVEAYPGGAPHVKVSRIVGTEDRWVVTPTNDVMRVAGSGSFWWSEWEMTYPDGQVYHCIDLVELRDGLVYREAFYWAPPFGAPEWRAPFVQPPTDGG
jgi:hypothetical protein